MKCSIQLEYDNELIFHLMKISVPSVHEKLRDTIQSAMPIVVIELFPT